MPLIEAFFKQTATIKPFIREASGEPIYAATEQRRCRFERGTNLQTTYKNPDGQIDQVLANAKMFCTGSAIPSRSVVTYDNEDFIVIKCQVLNGFHDDHLEVYLE